MLLGMPSILRTAHHKETPVAHDVLTALTPTGSSGTRVAAKESTIPQQLNVERHRHLRQPLQQLSLFAEAQQQQRQRQPPKPVPPSKAKLCAQSSGRADQEDLFSSEKVAAVVVSIRINGINPDGEMPADPLVSELEKEGLRGVKMEI
eukprot:gene25105-30637_t